MAGTKISALTAGIVPVAADLFPSVQSGATVKVTANQLRQWTDALTNASVSTVSAGYAVDTYLAGSAITIPTAGGWKAKTILKWQFDMAKTGAGSAGIAMIFRMGTLGTTADASPGSIAFAAGTAAADTGIFDVTVVFRTVGAGTAAVVNIMARCTHHLAATGLISTGASGVGILVATSGGFDSTTQTIAGWSFNGGASFSGTNTYVDAEAYNV